MRLGSRLKKVGSFLLFIVSFLAYLMTWFVELLSPLGGICIVGVSIGIAILMWLDGEEEPVRVSRKKNANRAETDR
ncbi:hypothetical protein GK047_20000 [Paenibacillus sp. SYP-B3998]|uniref:Uncharacterized protein n=1 Tax=Paenibacillus sp. SYP-B3998 TaxID=2678564 RepID=A0A6G4A393_9BACL|nr:hypothetical protein [Paenibacillus sp. SYP-B3998]NEW08289.1 hypothetical protein [Paenibacillus sp. SYP-B3998]